MTGDPKPYTDIKAALDQWRSFDDPVRADLEGKRRRRRLGGVVLVVLVGGCFGLGLTVVGLLRQHETNVTEYSESVRRINQMLADNQGDVLEDIVGRLDDRGAQLAGIGKRIGDTEAALRELREQKQKLETTIEAPGEAPSEAGEPASEHAAQERLGALIYEIAGVEARLLQLREEKFYAQRSIANLQSQREHVENEVAEIERERQSRQRQVDDENSPVTALQADLEAAERRVGALVETNDSLRSLTKRLTLECETMAE